MKKALILFVFVVYYFNSYSQNNSGEYFNRIVVGSSFSYGNDGYSLGGRHVDSKETYWNFNLAVDINKRWRVGLQYYKIGYKDEFINNEHYMMGVFGEFNVFSRLLPRSRFYLKATYNIGDYCTCGNAGFRKVENLNYIGFGFGYDIYIAKWFYLETVLKPISH
jgi:hypothetical protein